MGSGVLCSDAAKYASSSGISRRLRYANPGCPLRIGTVEFLVLLAQRGRGYRPQYRTPRAGRGTPPKRFATDRDCRSAGGTLVYVPEYMRGWRSYFGFCETPEVLIGLTRWVRLRLRAAMSRQWKTPRRRRAALLELGVREPLASNTDGSRRGPWYLAKAKALAVGLSNAYFKSLEPPCTDPYARGVAGVGG
uniref:Group II intron maturase-specific domain-containing protein n=1 Tax=Solibacter usitatus (strain Ellin6076) TaxID=234267 RepID=Q01RK8_SOLUE